MSSTVHPNFAQRSLSFTLKSSGLLDEELIIDEQGGTCVEKVEVGGLLVLKRDRIVIEVETRNTKTAMPADASVYSTTVDKDTERVELPLSWVSKAELHTSLLRTRLELKANTLQAFATVPSEDRGTLFLNIARKDREAAAQWVRALDAALAEAAAQEPYTALEDARHPVDPDILDWFRMNHPEPTAEINRVLRDYMDLCNNPTAYAERALRRHEQARARRPE